MSEIQPTSLTKEKNRYNGSNFNWRKLIAAKTLNDYMLNYLTANFKVIFGFAFVYYSITTTNYSILLTDNLLS